MLAGCFELGRKRYLLVLATSVYSGRGKVESSTSWLELS